MSNKFLAASLLALKHTFEQEWLAKNALRMLLLANNASDQLQKNFLVYFFRRSKITESDADLLFESLSSEIKNTAMSTYDMLIEKGRKEGIEKARQEASIEFVKNLLFANRFTVAEIANFASVTEAFVLEVKQAM